MCTTAGETRLFTSMMRACSASSASRANAGGSPAQPVRTNDRPASERPQLHRPDSSASARRNSRAAASGSGEAPSAAAAATPEAPAARTSATRAAVTPPSARAGIDSPALSFRSQAQPRGTRSRLGLGLVDRGQHHVARAFRGGAARFDPVVRGIAHERAAAQERPRLAHRHRFRGRGVRRRDRARARRRAAGSPPRAGRARGRARGGARPRTTRRPVQLGSRSTTSSTPPRASASITSRSGRPPVLRGPSLMKQSRGFTAVRSGLARGSTPARAACAACGRLRTPRARPRRRASSRAPS